MRDRCLRPLPVSALLGVLAAFAAPLATAADLAAAGTAEALPRTDHLTFAQGAIPVTVETLGAAKAVSDELAMQVIDGDPRGFTLLSRVAADGGAQIVLRLPALTSFDRFAVPNVLETPSPSQTFVRHVKVEGSAAGAEGPWQLLAEGDLTRHEARGQESELKLLARAPVRWIRLRVSGGLEILSENMFYEFSELIGNGEQEPQPHSEQFQGIWKGRGVLVELRQQGPLVSGCVDKPGEPLEGSVSGPILRARSVDPQSGVVSLFVLGVHDDGRLEGVRSTNGAPFRLMVGEPAPAGATTDCSERPGPSLGCDSVIHAIRFDVDSAAIRPDSEPLLSELHRGLSAAPKARIVIEGHTSSEGSTEQDQALSERRAAAVVADLVRRGIEAERINAEGRGESSPIASNEDESGRSLNRRVEVHCVDGPG